MPITPLDAFSLTIGLGGAVLAGLTIAQNAWRKRVLERTRLENMTWREADIKRRRHLRRIGAKGKATQMAKARK